MKKLFAVTVIVLFFSMIIFPSSGIKIDNKPIIQSDRGNTLYVGGNGSGNYSKIQDAIDNASDGDTVFVYDDSSPYYENVIINKTINLIGKDRDTTVIDGDYEGDVIYISAKWVNISGFSIQNSGTSGLPNHDAGIDIHSNYTTIMDNNISRNRFSIWFSSSGNNSIIGNNIKNNYYGFIISNTCNNIISENFLLDYLHPSYSDDNIITNNIIQSGRNGLNFYICKRSYVANNSFYNCSIRFYDSTFSNLSNNTVNGKPLIYLNGESNTIIKEAGQIILFYCHNITIKNLEISNVSAAIIGENINNCLISNNILENNTQGISLRNSSSFNIIKGNNISSGGESIRLTGSDNNIIFDNDIINGGEIYLAGCKNVSVIDNYITKEIGDGIYLQQTTYCNISNNILNKNRRGIFIDDNSNSNIISNNQIKNNIFYGINISRSFFNSIFHNNFINNPQNAYCEFLNYWDNGYPSGGNYWDDYNGEDNDGDGIGDTPYSIPGGDNEDRYPLMFPSVNFPPTAPIITGPKSGKPKVEYEYTFVSTDPNDDSVRYFIDWGDNTSDLTGYNNSGVEIKLKHTFNKGNFTIKAKAFDINGGESEWTEFTVTMPRDLSTSSLPLLRFLDHFPLLHRLLDIWRNALV